MKILNVHNFSRGKVLRQIRDPDGEDLPYGREHNSIRMHIRHPSHRPIEIDKDQMLDKKKLLGLEVKDMFKQKFYISYMYPVPQDRNQDLFDPRSFYMAKNFMDYAFEVAWHIRGYPDKNVTLVHPYRDVRMYHERSIVKFWETLWVKIRSGVYNCDNKCHSPISVGDEQDKDQEIEIGKKEEYEAATLFGNIDNELNIINKRIEK